MNPGQVCWLIINHTGLSEDQVKTLIGDQGAVLDSIQYLANTTLNLGKAADEQLAFTIELGGYRAKRLEELKAIANEAAEQVLASKQEFEIKGLSSAERRQVHHFLSSHGGLSTFSRGKRARSPAWWLPWKRKNDPSPDQTNSWIRSTFPSCYNNQSTV